MKVKENKGGFNPTASFIANQPSGTFIEILPATHMIKGAVNDLGSDQAYAVNNIKNEFILIDVVEMATKEAVESIVRDGEKIRAILITSKKVLNDAYADLQTLSGDAGGAEVYLHPTIAEEMDFETGNLSTTDSLLSSFNLEVYDLEDPNGSVLIYSSDNNGMLFTGESAVGSDYDSDNFRFSREELERKDDEFALAERWKKMDKEFDYLFPRKGKPVIEVDDAMRPNIINWLSRGGA